MKNQTLQGPVDCPISNNPVITKGYLFQEIIRFREMLGSRNYMTSWEGIEKLQKAFGGLLFVYLRGTATGIHPDTTESDIEQMKQAMESTKIDFYARVALAINPHAKLQL